MMKVSVWRENTSGAAAVKSSAHQIRVWKQAPYAGDPLKKTEESRPTKVMYHCLEQGWKRVDIRAMPLVELIGIVKCPPTSPIGRRECRYDFASGNTDKIVNDQMRKWPRGGELVSQHAKARLIEGTVIEQVPVVAAG